MHQEYNNSPQYAPSGILKFRPEASQLNNPEGKVTQHLQKACHSGEWDLQLFPAVCSCLQDEITKNHLVKNVEKTLSPTKRSCRCLKRIICMYIRTFCAVSVERWREKSRNRNERKPPNTQGNHEFSRDQKKIFNPFTCCMV